MASISTHRAALAAELGVSLQRGAAEVLQLRERLHAGVTAADDDEREQRAPPRGVGGLGGGLEPRQDVVAEVDGLVDRLEADGVLGESRHREHAAHRARRQDEHVVVEVGRRSLEEMDSRPVRAVVDRLDLADDEPGPAQHASQRDDDVAGLDGARRGLGEERLVLEVVLRVHEHDLVARGRGAGARAAARRTCRRSRPRTRGPAYCEAFHTEGRGAMPSPEQVQAAVDAYVAAYRKNDRDAFLDAFADDGVIIDPVGTPPHAGREAIGAPSGTPSTR